MMKAIVYEAYGSPDVLKLKEVAKPVPKSNEVLIKVHATTVTTGDWRVRSLNLPPGFGFLGRLIFGILKPRQPILGSEIAGVIESVGKGVSKFKVGDAVFSFSDAAMGCHAEYRCMGEDGPIALKPSNMSFNESAPLSFGGTTALSFLRRANLKAGDKILINGASGGVGTAAVQLAKHFGAVVTAVCSTPNVELVKSLGADDVIDYLKEDFTKNGVKYDVIMDIAGNAPYSRSKGSLVERGYLLMVLAGMFDMLQAPWISMYSGIRTVVGPAFGKAEDLRYLAQLAESGKFKTIIDKCYPFEKMADAHRHVDTGHKRGNIVVILIP
jgi:NADPH:quinone reductase-like Zn-dependent oxidoreductase